MLAQRDLQTDKLFVYGTLRRGLAPHEYLKSSARFLGKATIAGRLYDLGDFPGARPSDLPGEEIEGELYELRDLSRQLRTLDEYEEFDPDHPEKSLFVRQRVDVRLESGKKLEAWTYFLPQEPAGARRIRNGDYLEFRKERRFFNRSSTG